MAIRKKISEIGKADRPFLFAENHGDDTATLYYKGDVLPVVSGLDPKNISTTQYAFRLAFAKLKKLGDLKRGLSLMSEEEQIALDWMSDISRTHPVIVKLFSVLQYTPAQIDEIFGAAVIADSSSLIQGAVK